MKLSQCKSGCSSSKGATTKKVGKMNHPSVMPKTMKLICKGAKTTNPDDIQKY